jgi:hypothetical protein
MYLWRGSSPSEALFQRFAPRARDLDLRAAPELNLAVAAGCFEQSIDAIELHDRRAVDTEET